MYRIVEIRSTIRIPPDRLGEDLDAVTEDIVHQTFDDKMVKDGGLIVAAIDAHREGEGRVVPGDGAVYQPVVFEALTFKPENQELVDGLVYEVVSFGAFVRFGPLDGLLHVSQIMSEKVDVDGANQRLVGHESKRELKVGDVVRVRLVSLAINEMSPRDSRIGLTMMQPGLGKPEWIEEERAKERAK